jgi:hypothetical protein
LPESGSFVDHTCSPFVSYSIWLILTVLFPLVCEEKEEEEEKNGFHVPHQLEAGVELGL